MSVENQDKNNSELEVKEIFNEVNEWLDALSEPRRTEFKSFNSYYDLITWVIENDEIASFKEDKIYEKFRSYLENYKPFIQEASA